jgi:TPR repeat protein
MCSTVRRYCALLFLLWGTLSFAQAPPELREQGARAWRAGNVRLAIEKFEQGARLGDTRSMYFLAIIYDTGAGVPADGNRAKHLLRTAATAGDIDAEYFLYQVLSRNDASQEERQEAIKWLAEAANRGLLDAQVTIGAAYRQGKGVRKDPLEARKWFEAAATQGSGYAHFNLGLMYSWKELGAQDLDAAYRYFRGAAMLGNVLGLVSIADFERSRRYAVNGLCIFRKTAPDTPECSAMSVEFLRQRIGVLESGVLRTLGSDAAEKFKREREEWLQGLSAQCSIVAPADLDRADLPAETRQCVGAALGSRLSSYLDAATHAIGGPARDAGGEMQSGFDAQVAEALFARAYRDAWAELKGISSVTSHVGGKYYFEIVIDPARLAKSKTHQLDLFVGVTDRENGYGKIVKITAPAQRREPAVIGFAADLDAGKHYRHVDGAWVERSPKDGNGFEFSTATGPFRARASSENSLADLVHEGALQINFGNRPFRYPPPAGYAGFERPGSFMPEHQLQR